jgi:TolB-like protein/Tfp pilus assembly protein PilF
MGRHESPYHCRRVQHWALARSATFAERSLNESTRAVFLSYASQDAEAARRICDALCAAGIEVWFDQSELRGGDAWDASIRKRIKECILFVPVISANTNARSEGYFRLEWKLAVDRSHLMATERAFLLPVVIDDTRDADALVPDKFREVQWTRLPGGEAPAAFAERVARLLSPDASISRAAVRQEAGAAPVPGAPHAGVDPKSPGKAPTGVSPRRAPSRRVLFSAAALVAVLAVGGLVTFLMTNRSAAIASVAVLPFENATGDTAIEYLSDGISESLINKLSGLSGLRVISRTSAFAFKGKKMEPMEIGRKLGVDALILGSLAQRGASLAITAELVRVSNASQLWGEKYSRRADDMLQVEGEIAATIAQNLRRQLSGEERAMLARSATSDPEAYRLYLKGRGFLVGSQQEMDKSIDLLQQAVARAPEYALAHAGLAEAYTRQAFLRASSRTEALGKARAAANRALELDPDLAEAHTALGLIRFFFEWDWAGAEAEFRRALELNPGSSAVHEEYGGFLTAMGRLDEGLARSREAVRLDPLSVGPVHDMAINAWVRGDYEETAAGFRRTIEIDPNWTWGYVKLARILAVQKKCGEAFVQAEAAERKIAGGAAPLARSWLGATYALCGDTRRAREKLGELHALEKKQYVDPVTFATIHSALGEIDEAMRWYEKAFDDRTPNMVFAARAARFAPELADKPRYMAIVDRMGFPQPPK